MRLIWILTLLIATLLGASVSLSEQAAWPADTVHAVFEAPTGPNEIRRALWP
jgi:hypothetical protein